MNNSAVNLTVNKDDNKNILLKIEDKKVPEPKVQKFRSFGIASGGSIISLRNKNIPVMNLYEILMKYGLSKTLPMLIDSDYNKQLFSTVDWDPHNYGGPNVLYFNYDGIECSVCCRSTFHSPIYIRVHDMTPGIGEQIITSILDELYNSAPVPDKTMTIYTTSKVYHFQWQALMTRKHRNIDTIYMDKIIKQELVDGLAKFYNSADLYDKYGINWKKVYLFHGPPGTGKTSTVVALASIFNKNIAKFTIAPDLNGQDLERLFQTVPNDTFLLLEDVNSLFVKREAKSSIDFSTILNCLDGITTKRGLVVFMTTNHLDELDEALVRPGRIDVKINFQLPYLEQFKEALNVLAADYAHEHEEFINKMYGKIKNIPELQKYIFECIMNDKKSIIQTLLG